MLKRLLSASICLAFLTMAATWAQAEPEIDVSIVGVSNANQAHFNLTAYGTADWIYQGAPFNRTPNVNWLQRKALDPDEPLLSVNRFGLRIFSEPSPLFYWDDGHFDNEDPADGPPAVLAKENATNSSVRSGTAIGDGFFLTAPVSAESRTLYIWAGGHFAAYEMRVYLADSPDAVLSELQPVWVNVGNFGSQDYRLYTFTYSNGGQEELDTLIFGIIGTADTNHVHFFAAAITPPITEPTAQAVQITGDAMAGSLLTGRYDYAGPNPEGASLFRWLRADSPEGERVPIAGATGLTYRPAAQDIGKHIVFEVTPVDDAQTAGEPVQSAPTGSIAERVASLAVTRLGSPHSMHHSGVWFSNLPVEQRTHNLSEMGTTDWVHWGFSSAVGDRQTRKATGNPWLGVSLVQPAGFNLAGGRGGAYLYDYGDGLNGYTWNPGDDAPDRGRNFWFGLGDREDFDPQVYHGWGFNPPIDRLDENNKPIGEWGFRVAMPAPPMPSTLYLHTGAWNAIGDLTISLIDAEGQVVQQYTDLGRADARNQYRVEFEAAATAGHQLVIEWLFAENTHATEGSVGVIRLGAITLAVDSEAAIEPTAIAPAITGSEEVGGVLTGHYSYFGPFDEGASLYRWLRADSADGEFTAIVGATSQSYTLTSGDLGKFIVFEVTPVDVEDNTGTAVRSNPTGQIAEPATVPPVAENVAIDGAPRVGGILTGSYDFVGGSNLSEFRWLRADTEGGEYTAIDGATGLEYTLTAADAGKFIKFEVTPIDEGGPGSAAESAPTGPAYVLGDFNGDGVLSGLDIPGFKQALADPDGWATANPGRPHPNQLGDFNGDGVFSGLDIPGFKQALAGN